MNVYFREMKKNSISFSIWLIIMILVNAFMLASFNSVAEMAKNTEAMLSQYPEEFIKAMNLDILSMTNILHFYASRSFLMVTIFGSVYAIMLSSCIVSKEENEGTIEFLISKPIKRKSIISSKLLSVVSYVTLFNLLFSISNFILLNIFKTSDFSFESFLYISLGAWLIHMIFAFIGLAISTIISKTKTDISLSLGLVFIAYFISILASVKSDLSFLKYFSPFSYFNTKDLVINTTIGPSYLIISFVLITLAIIVSYVYYQKKDIAV